VGDAETYVDENLGEQIDMEMMDISEEKIHDSDNEAIYWVFVCLQMRMPAYSLMPLQASLVRELR